ncbi:hypothetical protein [Frigoribacterium sp. CFBP 8751]|uniref:hypothetical protein n=1 Tax=Frigoribacterium sp. CFBP 8751 TaxID=2775277 RepID=UPI00177AB79A|nr:hypothetical protein [Frigoribacterium sp. CFBP 8751]MBD8538755.1 hypothetical protein [Frigoribacterium sp. CFBP 8751]
MTHPFLRAGAFRLVASAASLLMVVSALVVLQPASPASAASFDAGNIISDQNFYDPNAMSQAQIQSFLEAQVPSCGNGNCLRSKRTDTSSRPADAMCAAYSGAAGELTSQIIFKVQQACSISAKVLLVTLQKEQTLITATAPSDARIDRAMGYACPDNPAQPGYCDPAYAGLYNQLYRAAWQLKRYGNPAGTSNYFTWYPVGQVAQVRYNPNVSCGSSGVFISNKATAALYYYTPYQPNAAALANLTGTGDACSAYGNRNFWRFYTSWFGATTGPTNPFGSVDVVEGGAESVRIAGWAVDPDALGQSLDVHAYVDGAWGGSYKASKARTDVAGAYPGAGSAHGFDETIPVPGGGHEICLYFINVGAGANSSAGCFNFGAVYVSPIGNLESITAAGSTVTVGGWVFDPDVASPVTVRVDVDGVRKTSLVADASRPDVASAYPAYGSRHGIAATFPVDPGQREICLTAVNIGAGLDRSLGCATVTIVAGPSEKGRVPEGSVEVAEGLPTGLRIKGWVVDRDTTNPVTLRVTVDGVQQPAVVADKSRPDVGSVFPGLGDSHGFDVTLDTTTGSRTVCVVAVNSGSGGDKDLGCRTVSVPTIDKGRLPTGNFEVATATPGSIRVAGWAIDPDTSASLDLVYSVGSTTVAGKADKRRADVAAIYPASGPLHGFDDTLSVRSGSQQVCVTARNTGTGGDSSLGCKAVTVPKLLPVGNLEVLSGGKGALTLKGWALLPGKTTTVPVHVYVDGAGSAHSADTSRPDVANAYPGTGPAHGFQITLPATPGPHQVCSYAIDELEGGYHQAFGCRTVVVD